jgi:glycine/D-amino acid oxidase-like deaminating enzyme/nitrite reductase/ring-hydroxylating ferredoxin subunit
MTEHLAFSFLKGNAHADVVVIGAGITGLTTAELLIEKGFNVILLEGKNICGSNTSQSTGNLYVTIDKNLSSIEHKYEAKTVKQILRARSNGIKLIEANIKKFSIDCDFERVPWHLYAGTKDLEDEMEKEDQILKEAGLITRRGPMENIPYPVQSAVILDDQAQFHPMKYGQGLARAIMDRCRIYENSPVIHIQEEKDHSIVLTPFGKITCKYVVHATHTPKGVLGVHTMLGPYREYGLAFKIKNAKHAKGIFWGHYDEKGHISTRPYTLEGETYMMVIGGAHKVGQDSSKEKIKFLEYFARTYFDFDEVDYIWGGQHYRPADLLPYIGQTHHETTFAATGFSTDGLTWGTVAAQIMCDEMTNVKNEYAKIFSYNRFTPFKSAKNFVRENFNVMAQYLHDLPGKKDAKTFEEVPVNEGKIIETDGQKMAVHRDAKNTLHICSAVCTHLECIVKWNDAEKSWDCPCHGSRFGIDGEILEGPATQNLDSVVIEGHHVILKESPWTSHPQS